MSYYCYEELVQLGERICTALPKGRWRLESGWACCPAHNDHHPSLYIGVGPNTLFFRCFGNCTRDEVVRALYSSPYLINAGIHHPDRVFRRPPHHVSPDHWHATLWEESTPIERTLAERYLYNRGLIVRKTTPLRYLARCWHNPTKQMLPALLAPIYGLNCSLKAIHRTYLDPQSAELAQVEFPTMLTAPLGARAIELAPATRLLGIAVGLEEGLAAQQILGLPIYVALATSRFHKLHIPDQVECLHLIGTNDNASACARQLAREAYARPGRVFVDELHSAYFKSWTDEALAKNRAQLTSSNQSTKRAESVGQ